MKAVKHVQKGAVLVTGACGHVGRVFCNLLKRNGIDFVPTDIEETVDHVLGCDLTNKAEVGLLFTRRRINVVVHLAGILPTAFRQDPIRGADVNLTGSAELIRQAMKQNVNRFVFASSMSVYGSTHDRKLVNEEIVPTPDEPYGASKRTIEVIGQTLAEAGKLDFVSLRIARVIGRGAKRTSSPWRSQMFERSDNRQSIFLPYAPDARLSLVHVDDAALALNLLVNGKRPRQCCYNIPVEVWRAGDLKELVEGVIGAKVELVGNEIAGPVCDGSRFAEEFGYQPRGLRAQLRQSDEVRS